MTASVKYWRLPQEEENFVHDLESLEPTLVFPYGVFPNPESVKWVSLREGFASTSHRLLLTPERFINSVRTTWIEGATEKGYTVDLGKSAVLYYRRGGLDGNQLSTTALSADWTYLSDDGKAILDHPSDFIRWGKKVMQWVRRAAPGWYQYKQHRLTPAADAKRQAGIELVS